MAVTMRLQRKGTHNKPFYHIVVTDSRKARGGKFIEKIGFYDPNLNPSVMEVKGERASFWYSKGAQVSNTVLKILQLKKVPLSRKVN
ncbi:MAG: 30S ribosomal protein S16 [Oligoflexales bacterium]